MRKVISRTLTSLGISVLIYFSLAAVLIFTGVPNQEVQASSEGGLSFAELYTSYEGLPSLKSYTARDGAELDYRYYPAQNTNRVLVLLHGSGWHSRYFLKLGEWISSQGLAHVYTPDLRGHGETPIRRGDLDYIDQFEDDLYDLIGMIREQHPEGTLIMGGHSSGGGLALRFAGGPYGNEADAYLLMSPFLKYNAPTTRKNSGGWANAANGRIAGLTMLNNVGIRAFNQLEVITFNMPEKARDGTETLAYTYRLNTAYAPRDYTKDLKTLQQPLLVAVGTADESFIAEEYPSTIGKYHPKAEVELVPGENHMGLVVGDQIQPILKEWITGLD